MRLDEIDHDVLSSSQCDNIDYRAYTAYAARSFDPLIFVHRLTRFRRNYPQVALSSAASIQKHNDDYERIMRFNLISGYLIFSEN